ncbi:hypothetical protein HanXRQr2_Chr03g0121901 [Helianthus annuus]|uniref:Uncharacterized protein n=1 Tax=Helianthus annuus TaxID=4232 RepID=A0A9K3NXS0_HELAN|nr:hypothetical protein HanXRQr2_Chr03g0121901 [Helianthus annuus]
MYLCRNSGLLKAFARKPIMFCCFFSVVLSLFSIDMSWSFECCCSCLSLTISAISKLLSLFSPSSSSSIPYWPTSIHGPNSCFGWIGCTTVLLLRIVFRRCLCPPRNPSLANSHLSGFTFLKPCNHCL